MKKFFQRLLNLGKCPVEHVKQMGKPIDPRMRLMFTIFVGSESDPTRAVKFYECKLCGKRSVVNPYALPDSVVCDTVNLWLDGVISTPVCLSRIVGLGVRIKTGEPVK